MRSPIRHSKAWIEREALREKGQFWTPEWIAEAMVAYLAAGGHQTLFDPAVGAGAFFRAAKTLGREIGKDFALSGTEIDKAALSEAIESGLSHEDLLHVRIGDFLLESSPGTIEAVVANPPYIRHHRLSNGLKGKLREFCFKSIDTTLDGRAGLHVYFLIAGLRSLSSGGRLAFISTGRYCGGRVCPETLEMDIHQL